MTSDADVRQDGRPAQHREAQMAQLHDGTSRPRRAALLAVTFAVTSLLAGCGGGGTQSPAA